ncbi:hypothetical protein CDD83_5880 [Cordyceps sp. RAO-2017]|nr:hypothetical protein CDD83_5880 [Cordyceps sp. RAO-2017]
MKRRSCAIEWGGHVLLCYDGEDFAYLRRAAGNPLMPLLAKPSVKLEPKASASKLKHIIERARSPAEAVVKVDINIYGPRRAAEEIGDTLSRNRLWLQKPDQAKDDVAFENPHFLVLCTEGNK